MAGVLSQSEIESLLAALDPGVQSSSDLPIPVATTNRHRADDFNLDRGALASKDVVAALLQIHAKFSQSVSAELTGLLGGSLRVETVGIDQLLVRDFYHGLETPTLVTRLKSNGLRGHLLLNISPSIIFPMIDRLLGGQDSKSCVPDRGLTEIELRLVSRIMDRISRSLESTWKNVCQLNLTVEKVESIEKVESDPTGLPNGTTNEMLAVIRFEIQCATTRGSMQLCIPLTCIETINGKLSFPRLAATHCEYQENAGTNQAEEVRNAVEMTIRLARTRLSAHDVETLEIGDVIMTDTKVNDGIQVLIDGRVQFVGRAGVLKDRKAVRIERESEEPDEVTNLQSDDTDS